MFESVLATLKDVAADCEPLGPVFRSLATTPPGERCAMLASGTASALTACGCARSAEVTTLVQWLVQGRPMGVVTVQLDPARPIGAAASTTWGDWAATHLTGETRTLWIALE